MDDQDRVALSLFEKETPGFTTYDLRAYWQATDRMLLLAGVENLTDKQYREHLDLRTGRGVFQPGAEFVQRADDIFQPRALTAQFLGFLRIVPDMGILELPADFLEAVALYRVVKGTP